MQISDFSKIDINHLHTIYWNVEEKNIYINPLDVPDYQKYDLKKVYFSNNISFSLDELLRSTLNNYFKNYLINSNNNLIGYFSLLSTIVIPNNTFQKIQKVLNEFNFNITHQFLLLYLIVSYRQFYIDNVDGRILNKSKEILSLQDKEYLKFADLLKLIPSSEKEIIKGKKFPTEIIIRYGNKDEFVFKSNIIIRYLMEFDFKNKTNKVDLIEKLRNQSSNNDNIKFFKEKFAVCVEEMLLSDEFKFYFKNKSERHRFIGFVIILAEIPFVKDNGDAYSIEADRKSIHTLIDNWIKRH